MHLSDEQGTTLVELLAAMVVGLLVLGAIFMLMDTTTRSTAQTMERMDTMARTRSATEFVRARLRAATCPDDGTAPLLEATDTRISFVARVADRPTGIAMTEPPLQRRTILLDGTELREEVYDLVTPGSALATFKTTPTSTRVILQGAGSPSGVPLFTFLDGNGTVIADPALRTEAARVQMQLTGRADRPERGLDATSDTTVVLRLDDPTDQDNTPEC